MMFKRSLAAVLCAALAGQSLAGELARTSGLSQSLPLRTGAEFYWWANSVQRGSPPSLSLDSVKPDNPAAALMLMQAAPLLKRGPVLANVAGDVTVLRPVDDPKRSLEVRVPGFAQELPEAAHRLAQDLQTALDKDRGGATTRYTDAVLRRVYESAPPKSETGGILAGTGLVLPPELRPATAPRAPVASADGPPLAPSPEPWKRQSARFPLAAAVLGSLALGSGALARLHSGDLAFSLLIAVCMTLLIWRRVSRAAEDPSRLFKSEQVSPIDRGALYEMVSELCRRAGRPMPSLWIRSTPRKEAAALPFHEGAIIVTRGLLDLLDERELMAVLGHELSHVRHGIRLYVEPAALAFLFMNAMASVMKLVLLSTPLAHDASSLQAFALGGAASSGLMLVMMLGLGLTLSPSRGAEFAADEGAAWLTGDPDAMISALRKLSPRPPPSWTYLLSTHPALVDRVARLARMKDAVSSR